MKGSGLLIARFFDVQNYGHHVLFDSCLQAWEPLLKLVEYLNGLNLGAIKSPCPEGVVLERPELISIEEGCTIEAGAYIRGPCVIGKNCQIRHGAYIRGDVLIGDSCVVGHATELKHSILLNHAKAAHFAFVGDSILGNDVNLGAGVKCANLRLDRSVIDVQYGDQRYQTGLRKFGAVIGDRCQIGCNAVTNPGTLCAKDVCCHPTVLVGGVLEEGAIVRPANRPQIVF